MTSAHHAPVGVGGDADVFLAVTTKRAGAIKGEAVADGHADDIQLRGWSWGVAASSAIGSTASTARRQYKRLVVTKEIDCASTSLLTALVGNDEVKQATLCMRKSGGTALDYFRMTLSGARVVDIDIDVDARGMPVERVAFAFTRIDIEYKRQQATGGNAGAFTFTDEVLASN